MKKLNILLSVVAMSFVMIGCGGGSGGDNDGGTSAESILVGNTFYYTNDYLDFEDGYYKNYFGSSSATETEHMSNGTMLYTDTITVTYSGTSVVFNINGTKESCGVTRQQKSVILSCPSLSGDRHIWDTIEDAKANPHYDY